LGRPQLLGTRGHFSQGVVETRSVSWNARAKVLTGKVRGNGGDPTVLYFYVPEGMKLAGATLAEVPVELRQAEPSVLALDVPALEQPTRLALSFEGSPRETQPRPFVMGPAAQRLPE
jgi:hypothetical protein